MSDNSQEQLRGDHHNGLNRQLILRRAVGGGGCD